MVPIESIINIEKCKWPKVFCVHMFCRGEGVGVCGGCGGVCVLCFLCLYNDCLMYIALRLMEKVLNSL